MLHYNFPLLGGVARPLDAREIERFADPRLSESRGLCLTKALGG
jgi:hypothetical protein